MRHLLLVLPLLLGTVPPLQAQVSLGIGVDLPGLSIGINLPAYPELQQVPGYPVYYAPRERGNYFFYDGRYWVLQGEDWYSSGWYNGPWRSANRDEVPAYVLRVPVRYYRQPPAYFGPWRRDVAPRWGEHWGNDWQQRRPDWNRWDRRSTPPPAPPPVYQRKYPQSRYPQDVREQQDIHTQNSRGRPDARQDVRRDSRADDRRNERKDDRKDDRKSGREDDRGNRGGQGNPRKD